MAKNSKNRYLDTFFWNDNYIMDRDPTEKLLFLYFLSNPSTHICGIYEIGLKRIAFDTGIDREMVIKILDRFEKDKKIKYKDGWIAIKNFIKHQKKNPSIQKGIDQGLKDSPPDLVTWIQQPDTDCIQPVTDSPQPDTPSTQARTNININSNTNLNNNTDILSSPRGEDKNKVCLAYNNKIKGRSGYLPRYCKKVKMHGWCEKDAKFCLNLFNKFTKKIEQFRKTNNYPGVFNNQLKDFLEKEKGGMADEMRAHYKKMPEKLKTIFKRRENLDEEREAS